jgi:hypothetical protein
VNVRLVLHCCYTGIALLLHCCYTVDTLYLCLEGVVVNANIVDARRKRVPSCAPGGAL